MRSIRAIVLLYIAVRVFTTLAVGQTAPNIENGFKSFGSYDGSGIDTVNLQNGNLMFHAPLFSYPQRGGKISLSYAFRNSSKNWQVEQYQDSQHNTHSKWVLAAPAAVYIGANVNMSVQRMRLVLTDTTGNQTTTLDGYSVTTPDQAVHWFPENLANNNMVTVDNSGFQYTLTASVIADRSMDTAVVTDRQGSQYYFPHISRPTPPTGNSTPVGFPFTGQRTADGLNTLDTINDNGIPVSVTDANGNIFSAISNEGIFGPYYQIFPSQSGGPVSSSVIPFPVSTPTATTDYSGCVTTHTISQAMILPFPGPDGRTSNVKVCGSTFIPAASFSQANVDPPNPNPPASSYNSAGYSYIVSAVMPDGNYWSFDYDGFGNITSVHLPTGGTITYQWQEISLPACNANITLVSRALSTRTVNDLVNPPQTWHYTWGIMQSGSLTNYVQDPNGNETAHVFTAPVSTANCELYETETRYYQGTHSAGTLLKTVDTHYLGTMDDVGQPGNTLLDFGGHVVADTVTITLPTGQISQIVRQYDNYPNSTTFGKVTDEKVYDYGSSPHGALLRETVTIYQWQVNSAYLNAGFIDLPASVVVKDGSGCSMAETDYTYDEPGYLTTYTGTLPTGTHGAAPGGTVRGNLTTVTKWAAPTSSCNPKSGTAIASHTNWYDTGEVYQQIDPLGHTTTYSYDPYYAGAFVTQTCAPSTSGVSHCVSGTYDSATGLLESLTNENATTQASGNTPGDSAHTSNYSYDTSWRLIQAQAPPDPANSSARATTVLTPSTPNVFPLSVQHQRSVTTALTDTSTAYFDGADRVNKTTHALPNGTATVVTTYDGVGQATGLTNPYFTTSDPTYGITSSYYDGLGRVTQTAKQDGSISTVKYNAVTSIAMNAECTITKDEAGNQGGACTDALGRVVEVDEPNPGTTPTVSNYATMQTDGNFVLYNPTNTALWSTGTSGAANAQTVLMQDDGNLVLYIFKWFAGVYAASSPGPFPAATCSIGTYLVAGETLPSGKCIASPHGQYFLYMSPDGNFYIYDYSQGHASWDANVTVGHPGAYALLQMDGNFVVNDVNGVTLWSSGTGGSYAERLDMEDDGRMIIWKSAWNSGTSTGQFNTTQLTHPGCDVGTGIGLTGAIGAGQCVVSPNGHYELLLRTDGNMVIYDLGVTPANLLWATNTLISSVDPGVAMRTLYTYDALGNLTCVEQHGGVTGTGCSSSPANDATSPWRVRRFAYDSVGRLLTATNPELGTISYTYDNDGNLLRKTSPAPNQTNPAVTQTISYCYDELHRVRGRAYGALGCPLASPVVSYIYDSGTNAKGKLTSMTDQAGSATYTYDMLGRMSSETRVISGVSKSMSYGYNLDGSISTLTYPSGAVVTYTPDSAGRMVSAVDNAHGINFVTSATYGPDGSVTGFVNGSAGAATITNTFTYNKRLQPVNMSAATSSQTVFSLGYDFHFGNGDNGNVWGITNYRDANRNQSFTYDALNRLLSAQNAGTDCTIMTGDHKTEYWGNSYAYDAWGNLTNKTVTKCSAEGLNLISLVNNRLSGYGYDAAGNMTNDGIFTYTFDQENRLIGAHGYTYTYDGEGNRVAKTNGTTGTLYWYMAPGVMDETDLSGNNPHEYVFFNGQRVARKDSNGLVYYFFSDHLKTASIITDSSGNLKADSDYYPWGGELEIYNNFNNTYKFSGKERDSETGLDYFGARYYHNALGRFMTPDWAAKPAAVPYAVLTDPQSLNLYSYVRNIPTSKVDLDGHCPPDAPNCNKLENNPVAKVSPAVKQAINNSVKASNHPTADDKKGRSHEEGGVAWTKDGKQTVAPAEPGKFKDVKKPGAADMDPYKAADPSKAKPGDIQADVQWHVHPSAQIVETTGPQQGGGQTTVGGTVTEQTYQFNQPPSQVDIQLAQPAPTINLVIGARDNTVYVYDSSGTTCKEPLKEFNKEQKP